MLLCGGSREMKVISCLFHTFYAHSGSQIEYLNRTRLDFYTIIIILNLAFILLPNICIHDNENKMKNNSKMDKKPMTSRYIYQGFFCIG